jgi:hypothetical protein
VSTDTSRTRDDDTQPAAAERDQRAERATTARTSDNGASGHPSAETRTRAEYTDAMHARPPIRYDQPGPDGDSRKDRRPAEPQTEAASSRDQAGGRDRDADTDRARQDRDGSSHHEPAAGPGDHPRHGEPSRQAGEGRTQERTGSESRTREEDTAAPGDAGQPGTRGDAINQDADHPGSPGSVTHFHGEFKGQQMDLYTDGNRWAAAERPRNEDMASSKPEVQDPPPTGEELVGGAGEKSSLLDRLRKETYRESGDAMDNIDKGVNLGHDVFAHPPTGSYEGTPRDQPNISPAQHSGIDAGTAATAIFVLGLAIERGIHSVMRYAKNIRKGNEHAGD